LIKRLYVSDDLKRLAKYLNTAQLVGYYDSKRVENHDAGKHIVKDQRTACICMLAMILVWSPAFQSSNSNGQFVTPVDV